jgi:hypothetical protein
MRAQRPVVRQRLHLVPVARHDSHDRVVRVAQPQREGDRVLDAVVVRREVADEGQALDHRGRALQPGGDEEGADSCDHERREDERRR